MSFINQMVVCAAIRNKNGLIICGARHYDDVMRAQVKAIFGDHKTWAATGPIEQGFIDQQGNFLTRGEAYVIANARNQIIRRVGSDKGELFSENLY